MAVMNTLKPLEFNGSSTLQESSKETFPVITRKDINKRRVLVQRSKSISTRQNVPAPGHEYDYRRTPESGRVSPRKNYHGQIRPYIPPDTADLEALRLNVEDEPSTPVINRNKRRARLDISRCPTPMHSEEEEPGGYTYHKNLDTARSAWTSGTNNYSTLVTEGQLTQRDAAPRFQTNKTENTRLSSHHRRTIPNSSKGVFTDLESETVTPTPSMPLDLTEDVLNIYYQRPVDKDKRIVRWIVDCEEKSRHALPSHLPNISRTATVSLEEF